MSYDELNLRAQPKYDQSLSKMFSDTGYCFVHIPKNGGTSVESVLFKGNRVGHRTWKQWYTAAPEPFVEWKKFAILRDPIDRYLSAYDYLSKGGRNAIDAEFGRRFVKPYRDINSFTFSLKSKRRYSQVSQYFHFRPQSDYVLSDNKICKVNHLLSFDNYTQELAGLLGMTTDSISHKNKTTGKRTLKAELNMESIALLREIYDKDFVLCEKGLSKGVKHDFYDEVI